MRAAGVRMAPTSPLYRLHTISYRNHRKITVIDGAIGYTGGMNIGQEHLDGGKGFDSWRDTQLRIVGEAAAVLQAVFMVDWYNAVRENLFSAAYFPPDATEPGGRRRAGPDPDVGARFAVGGDPAALLLHDRGGAAARLPAVALLHPRCDASPRP